MDKRDQLAPANPDRKKRLKHWKQRITEIHASIASRAEGRLIDQEALDMQIADAIADNSDTAVACLGRTRTNRASK